MSGSSERRVRPQQKHLMDVMRKEYTEHSVSSELEQYEHFYDRMSMSVMSFVTMGTNAVLNIDTYAFSSIQGTIESIGATLSIGRINDAFALLRKYHDSVVINVYANLYLKEHVSLENFAVETIDNWVKGTAKLPKWAPGSGLYFRIRCLEILGA